MALVVVLVILFVVALIAALFVNEGVSVLQGSDREQDAIEAFYAAEAGLEAGRDAFLNYGQEYGLPDVTGDLGGPTFEVEATIGEFQDEEWVQWGYDWGMTRYNPNSTISSNLVLGWRKEFSPADNGTTYGVDLFGNSIFTIVSGELAFFSFTDPSTDQVHVAAFNENDGDLVWTTEASGILGQGLAISSMGSSSESETVYFTYTSENSTSGTVRLVALNFAVSGAPTIKWSCDTGIHGVGSAPTIYNPDDEAIDDEIIYFTVAAMPDLVDLYDLNVMRIYPRAHPQPFPTPTVYDRPEGVYLFSVCEESAPCNTLDQGPACVTGTDPANFKWEHAFPDPDFAEHTDYPTERLISHPSGRNRGPADIAPLPPQEDLVPDYHNEDGFGNGQVNGDLYLLFFPAAFSPPVLRVDSGPNLIGPEPRINVYFAYTAVTDKDISAGAFYKAADIPPADEDEDLHWRAYIAAVQDTPSGRFPRLKFRYPMPGHDTDRFDGVPWDEDPNDSPWETWFEQTTGPMVVMQETDQDGTLHGDLDADGTDDTFPVIYMPYESLEWATHFGLDNSHPEAISHAKVMALQDDCRYAEGDVDLDGTDDCLNADGLPYTDYWNHDLDGDGVFEPNPYSWAETDLATIGDVPDTAAYGTIVSDSQDIDVEGESLAYYPADNRLFFVFNHDTDDITIESLQLHAIDAVRGGGEVDATNVDTDQLAWRHDVAAFLGGEVYNATPAVAGGMVFLLYRSGLDTETRTARLAMLRTGSGLPTATSPVTLDEDCDAANLAPTVANNAVYVGTYHDVEKEQRVFAYSPNLNLESTGFSTNGRGRRTLALTLEDGVVVEWRDASSEEIRP